MPTASLLSRLGVDPADLAGPMPVRSPIDGTILARLAWADPDQAAAAIGRAQRAFLAWREVPAPRRGDLVRRFGEELRRHKDDLAALVTLECGKIVEESRGEVQEMIDVCDFAAGLSRQLHGLTIASERPAHRMMETWHPLGVVGVISAFNFPVAVWAWNAVLALVCGDAVVWKPSERTPLSALAATALLRRAAEGMDTVPADLVQVVTGGRDLALALADDGRVPLLSATGSCAMGRALAPRVATRLGRSLLELGGNNAAIVCPSADLGLAARAILFAAAGTAGQRCTTLRRLIVHASVCDRLLEHVERLFATLPVGDPRRPGTLVGPLIDEGAFARMQDALARGEAEGGRRHGGERVQVAGCEGGVYARPALMRMPAQTAVVCEETFAPILWAMEYEDFDQAIAMHNAVPQGLSSAIFTTDLREAETFLAAGGSDCGIANVNTGPSGAEIGGAFGGEKDSGGGRESGSDCWKSYMRRMTSTINRGSTLPLSQGVSFISQ